MPKASPMFRSFNAGEFSELLAGRVDLDRYPASLRQMLNFVAAPQGPAIGRSGTTFVANALSDDTKSRLVPFVFSNDQSVVLEFGDGLMRILTYSGVQVYDPVDATVTSSPGSGITFTAPGLDAEVGDKVVLSDFPNSYNLNGREVAVTGVSGDSYTVAATYPAGVSLINGKAARVYRIECDYTEAELSGLRYIQSVDVVYLLTPTRRPRKLSRYGDYDWRLEDVEFEDGPYLPVNETANTLTPDGTGNAVPVLTANGVSYVTATVTSAAGDPIEFTAVGLDAEVGELVSFDGFADFDVGASDGGHFPGSDVDFEYDSLNGAVAKVTAKSGDDYTVNIEWPSGATVTNGQVAIALVGGSTYRPAINGTYGAPVNFLQRTISYSLDSGEYYKAFDADDESYWAASEQQKGDIFYVPETPFVADGYTIYPAKDNQDTSYASKDFAPSTFTFEGYDGDDWVVLDRQEDYVLYDGGKSIFFEIPNETAYEAYRLNIAKLYRNGLIEPRVRRLVIRDREGANLTLTAKNTDNINNDTGFQSTDVGRLVRLKSDDGAWRSCKITAVNSTTSVDVDLLGEPLFSTQPIREWRLGYWSDTTGWPNTGGFFEDRLWLAGSSAYPDLYAGSVTGAYETFSQTDYIGTVLDDSAVVARLNSRKLSRILWLAADSRGMLVGTGSEEYVLASPNDEPLTARNIKARPTTRRGSQDVEPVLIDNQVLFVQRGGRAVREFAFVFEADNYKAPSMSQLAPHLGVAPFEELAYAQEPYSIVWARRKDGTVVGLTYNREENVIGWHRHDFAGANVESIATIPGADGLQDVLFLACTRVVNGATRRYIERLERFWDYDSAVADAHFVDSGLRYEGSDTKTVYGLTHLEGQEVYGLADDQPVGPLTVEGGAVELPVYASRVVLGLGFEAYAELQRPENGAADGTAQGKVKRVNNAVISLWRSFGGEFGMLDMHSGVVSFDPLDYPQRFDEYTGIELYTGLVGPITPRAGYDMDAIMAFRRTKDSPLPFNVVAVMPQLNTQDR